MGKLVGGVAQLKQTMRFGEYLENKYVANSVNGYDAYYFSVYDRKYMLASSMRYTGLLIRPVSE